MKNTVLMTSPFDATHFDRAERFAHAPSPHLKVEDDDDWSGFVASYGPVSYSVSVACPGRLPDPHAAERNALREVRSLLVRPALVFARAVLWPRPSLYDQRWGSVRADIRLTMKEPSGGRLR